MKRLHIIASILSTMIVSSTLSLILWYQNHKHNSVNVDPTTVDEMENYFRQKECTQIAIDQSNGYDVELPEYCPAY